MVANALKASGYYYGSSPGACNICMTNSPAKNYTEIDRYLSYFTQGKYHYFNRLIRKIFVLWKKIDTPYHLWPAALSAEVHCAEIRNANDGVNRHCILCDAMKILFHPNTRSATCMGQVGKNNIWEGHSLPDWRLPICHQCISSICTWPAAQVIPRTTGRQRDLFKHWSRWSASVRIHRKLFCNIMRRHYKMVTTQRSYSLLDRYGPTYLSWRSSCILNSQTSTVCSR